MNPFIRRVLFFLFFLSGCSSLVYQVVWTRLAFASFGIIMPVLSVVLSVFMLGLAVGSWAGGHWIPVLTGKTGLSAAFFYAGAELVIGLGAFVVPKLFAVGERVLLTSGETDSFGYLSLSALVLTVSILPWCVCMGATFPFMMAYVREQDSGNTGSFSFLYLANVLGAMSGTFLAAVVWIEVLGFHHTLWLAAAGNFTAAFISALPRPWAATAAARSFGKRPFKHPLGFALSGSPRRADDKNDFVFDGVRGDGNGGGVDARLHAGVENAGLFLRVDCVHLFGRDLFGFLDVSGESAERPP